MSEYAPGYVMAAIAPILNIYSVTAAEVFDPSKGIIRIQAIRAECFRKCRTLNPQPSYSRIGHWFNRGVEPVRRACTSATMTQAISELRQALYEQSRRDWAELHGTKESD